MAAKRLPRVVVFRIKGGKLSVRAGPGARDFVQKFSRLLKRSAVWRLHCSGTEIRAGEWL